MSLLPRLIPAFLLAALPVLGATPSAQRITPAPQQAPAPASPTNGVAIHVGEEVVTLSELNTYLRKELAQQANTTPAQDQILLKRTLRKLILDYLEPQAGDELGFDPRQLDLILAGQVEDERREKGVLKYTEDLEDLGLDAFSAEDASRRDLLRVFWRRDRLGMGVADQRPTMDRYIRPGQLRAIYREKKEELAPTQVRFEVLMISSRAMGGPEYALTFCEEAKERIEAGEEFAALVEEFGADLRETGGLTPPIPLPALPDGRLAEIGRGPVGILAGPMPIFGAGGPDPSVGYQLCRLASREEPPERRFDDAQVQNQLRNYVSNVRDSRLLSLEQERLWGSAFVWIHPLLEGVGPDPLAP